MDEAFGVDRDDPDTNLLKGYYTLCVEIEPWETPISDEQVKKCIHFADSECLDTDLKYRKEAINQAHKYFQKGRKGYL